MIKKTIYLLEKEYSTSKYYLNFSNPVQLLVATILSAQCRDEIVNNSTKILFKKYKKAEDFCNIKENEIKSITFFKNKCKNIRETCKILVEKYNGKVPDDSEKLIDLPGIGRKTANVIMQNAFNIIEGIIVDTHVIRLSYRLGWTKNKNPDKIEQDLMKIIPKENWKELPH